MQITDNAFDQSLPEFVSFLKKNNIRRFHFVYDKEQSRVVASHPQLQALADLLSRDTRDMDKHEGVFCQLTQKHDILQAAFIHRTCRGQAAGGARFWTYRNTEDFMRDGLRLAKGMTHKNALAGIWWGGGKGVMAASPGLDIQDLKTRSEIYQEFGELITAIQGCYVTAEDVGTCVTDMHNIFKKTRFTTCIPSKVGGSGNPSAPTARGVVAGMEGALDYLGMGDLNGKTVALQGMGHVAEPMIGFLFEKGASLVKASDIDAKLIKRVENKFAGKNLKCTLSHIGDNAFLASDCDILAPCAVGAILNPQTIPQIKAKIICGAANNQLEDPQRDGLALKERGVSYVPDFLTNRMGIVNCADEQSGYVANDPLYERHLEHNWEHSVFQVTKRVFEVAEKSDQTPGDVALGLAEELSFVNHPIMGHRGQQIINTIVNEKWFAKE
jgi:glutamate dehydrogenase/leucine dehydrogenase